MVEKTRNLWPGTSGSLSWSSMGVVTGTICYQMELDRMILYYRHRRNGGEWESIEQVIFLDRTSCNYGGLRQWFLCPQCSKRVVVLYGAGIYFRCRHCYGLTYSSQQEGKPDRLMRKARKIRERLGGSINLMEPILFKPKNMHQKTFDRLRREEEIANNLSWIIMGQRLGIRI